MSQTFMSYMNDNANLSLKNYGETCSVAYSFRESPKVVGITAINTLMGMLNLVALIFLWKSPDIRKIWSILCTDLKIVISTGLVFYVSFAVNSVIFFGYNTLMYLSDLKPCSYIFSGINCYYLQAIYMAINIKGFYAFHVMLFLERAYGTFMTFLGFKRKLKMGILASCVMFILTAYFPIALWMAPSAYANDRVVCFSPITVIDISVNWMMLLNIFNDAGITLLEFLLLIWNRYRLKKFGTRLAYFTLEDKFNLREIKISISVIYPYSLVHSIGYCFQIYTYVWFATEARDIELHEGVYRYGLVHFTRLGCSLASLLFLLIYVRIRARRSNVIWTNTVNYTEMHFKELERIFAE